MCVPESPVRALINIIVHCLQELLSKTEREDQEQNFSFTSRPVHSKRASARPTQGGSLQDITEATKQEYGYTEYCTGSSLSHKRHGGGGHGGSRNKRQISSVSSRQREGGSLPSNVNETTTPSYISEQPFLNEVRRPLKSTSAKFAAKSNDYGALLQSAPLNPIGASDWSGLAGEESQSGAAGGGDGGTGGCTGAGPTSGGGIVGSGTGPAAHTVINMGELDSDEGPSGHRGFRDMYSGHANNALQQVSDRTLDTGRLWINSVFRVKAICLCCWLLKHSSRLSTTPCVSRRWVQALGGR